MRHGSGPWAAADEKEIRSRMFFRATRFKNIVDKELEIIKAEIANSGKPMEMAEKISKGKIAKFLNDNSLLNQIWIMDPKKKVQDILKELAITDLKIKEFVRFKIGE